MKRILHVMILVCAYATSWAQNQTASEAVKAFEQTYAEAKSLELHFRVQGFDQAGQLTMDQPGSLYKQDAKLRSEHGGILTLSNDDCHLVVNHRMRQIHTQTIDQRARKKQSQQADRFGPLTEVPIAQDGWEFIQRSAETEAVAMNLTDGPMTRVELHYHPGTKALQKVVYHYPDQEFFPFAKVEVAYDDVRFEVEDESIFSESSFVQKERGHYVAADALAAYQVIDQSQQ